jgi:1,2-diacylglycerol 3-alpha-glucosyltransferase
MVLGIMRPIADLTPAQASPVRLVLTDIDDTLTHAGKLSAEAYMALWELRAAGLLVVPITGRPAGWCDAIARQWPVDAVVGENGAFVLYERDGGLRSHFHPNAVADTEVPSLSAHRRGGSIGTEGFPSHDAIERIRGRLIPVRDQVLRAVPGSRVAKDQPYRIFDLAIDFREDEPDLGFAAAEQIRVEAERLGCVAKISSIHVNCWFGQYDKLDMARWMARELFDLDVVKHPEQVLFVGDSPNDAPMFAGFPVTAGVANVMRFVDTMPARPAFVATSQGGAGFAEIARVLLTARAAC